MFSAHQRTERFERALPRQERETLRLDDCDMAVTGWVVQLFWVEARDHRGLRPTLRPLRIRKQPHYWGLRLRGCRWVVHPGGTVAR
jgi:hypothetical protein